MKNAERVSRVDSVGDLPQQCNGAFDRQRSLTAKQSMQRLTLDVLHHEIKRALFGLAKVGNADSVWMLNGSSGIKVDSPNNLIIRNTVGNNTSNYNIGADNRYGPVIDITSGGTAAVNGNSASDTTTTTNPWANFAY